MLRAEWIKYRLDFKFLAKTSRETMRTKDTYFVRIADSDDPSEFGLGECNLFAGLSEESAQGYEDLLSAACEKPEEYEKIGCSSINFGFETALADLKNGGIGHPFPSAWSKGKEEISINGLVWMGDKETMLERIGEKIDRGFGCLKLKIGGIDFDEELSLLRHIRSAFGEKELEIRLDANGAFKPNDAISKLYRLADYHIHSIEQPIKAGQWEEMAGICHYSPIDIALDEELIGIKENEEKESMLDIIKPRYVILKPALCGGFKHADQWIETAKPRGIGWWATSALESNVGLNAIAQWVSLKSPEMPQGLGTGSLYYNNVPSPIEQIGQNLKFNPDKQWNYDILRF